MRGVDLKRPRYAPSEADEFIVGDLRDMATCRAALAGGFDEVYQLALDRGRQMRGLGITIDFAPVVDVSNQGDDTVIGDRSFSNDPAVVTTYAGAYARGLRDAGLLSIIGDECYLAPEAGDLKAAQFPDNLEAVITTRIDRLSPQLQLVVKVELKN